MDKRKTGISRDLIIHPGETIAEVITERGISQAELAMRTDVSAAYISNVISGKKNISAKFAMNLEYALGTPKSFWLNLQAIYDAELLEYNELQTITDEERLIRTKLSDVVKRLQDKEILPSEESQEKSILSLRKVFHISNIGNLKKVYKKSGFDNALVDEMKVALCD